MHSSQAFAMLFALLSATQAQACAMFSDLNPRDVEYADVVVVGRIANYELVLDRVARQRRVDYLASAKLPPELREILEHSDSYLSDYARFEIVVEDVLRGEAERTLTVTWDNSTFDEPEHMPAGPFLIALRDLRIPAPQRSGLGSIFVDGVSDHLIVLQAPCSRAFILENTSEEASVVRQILRRPGN